MRAESNIEGGGGMFPLYYMVICLTSSDLIPHTSVLSVVRGFHARLMVRQKS